MLMSLTFHSAVDGMCVIASVQQGVLAKRHVYTFLLALWEISQNKLFLGSMIFLLYVHTHCSISIFITH